MLKTSLAEFRESCNTDYVRQVLVGTEHLSFRERFRLVRETQQYKFRAYVARVRWTWVVVVGLLMPLPVLSVVKLTTRRLDGDVSLWISIPIVTAYEVAAAVVGWRIGSVKASRVLAQQTPAPRE